MTVSYKENLVQHIQYLYISLDWRQGISGILKTTSADNTIILSRLEAAPTLLLQNIVVVADFHLPASQRQMKSASGGLRTLRLR